MHDTAAQKREIAAPRLEATAQRQDTAAKKHCRARHLRD